MGNGICGNQMCWQISGNGRVGGGPWVGVCSILAIRMPLPYSQDLWNLFPMSLHSPSFSCVWNPLGRGKGSEISSLSLSFLLLSHQCSSFTFLLMFFLLPPGSPILFSLLM